MPQELLLVVALVGIVFAVGLPVWGSFRGGKESQRKRERLETALLGLRLERSPGDTHPGEMIYEGIIHDALVTVTIGDLERLRIRVRHPQPPQSALHIHRRPKLTVPLPTTVTCEQLEWYLKIESPDKGFLRELRQHELLRDALMALYGHDVALITVDDELIEIATLVTTPETMTELVIAAVDVVQYLRTVVSEPEEAAAHA